MKKIYDMPKLTVHGKVEQITQVGGSVPPTDKPKGQPNQAFPLS